VTVFVNTLPWCGARFAAFERAVLAAVALDCCVVQPAVICCVLLYRWMLSEEPGGTAVHSLHPVDGQTLPDPDEDLDDTDCSDLGESLGRSSQRDDDENVGTERARTVEEQEVNGEV
jgi:hypothetical protein